MNRLIHVRMMLALALSLLVGAIGFATAGARETVSEATPVRNPVTLAEIPTLPTISVHATAEIPTLPLVIVRPTRDEGPDDAGAVGLASVSGGNPALSLPDVLPHVRMDMPYYSFGKLLPRTIKE